MRTAKIVGFSMLGVFITIPALLIGLAFSINPTYLLPTLKQELLKQNIDAQFASDLSWQLYPNFGLNISDVEIRQTGDNNTSPLASIGNLNFSVSIKPLLSQKIEIHGISLTGVSVYIHTDKNGNTNWEGIASQRSAEHSPASAKQQDQNTDNEKNKSNSKTNTSSNTKESTPANHASATASIEIKTITLDVREFQIKNDTSGSNQKIKNLQLNINNFNLTGTPFTIDGTVSTDISSTRELTLNWKGNASLSNSILDIKNLTLIAYSNQQRLANIQLNNHTSWSQTFTTEGQFSISEIAPKKLASLLDIVLFETTNKNALSSAGISTQYRYANEILALDNTLISIDQSQLRGNTRLNFNTTPIPAISTHWSLNNIILDDYLTPTPEEKADTATTIATEETPLPIELLTQLEVDASLKAENVNYTKQDLKNLNLKVSSHKGKGTLKFTAENAFDGRVNISGTSKIENVALNATTQGDINNLNVGMLAKTFAELENIEGQSNIRFNLTSTGATDKSLFNNLLADISIESQKMLLNPVNIEKQFCNAVALLQGNLPSNDIAWNDFTQMSPVTIKAKYQAGAISLENLSATIAQLNSIASGSFNTTSGAFNIPFKLSLENTNTNAHCGTISEKWKAVAIPILCKGNINSLDIKTCLPDRDLITAILKEKLKQKAKQKGDKAEQKFSEKREELKEDAKDKLEQKAGKIVDKETSDKLEDAWKNILNKRKTQ